MALACAVLRTQGATVQLARNTDRQDAARRAALSGLSAAIRRMHVQNEWGGVGTTWSGSLSATQSFSVTYTAGDASLASTDPAYAEYPYRVTLTATGDPCSRTLRIYMDGRARFDFVLTPNGRVNINSRAVRGPGVRCRVQFRPIAGFGDSRPA